MGTIAGASAYAIWGLFPLVFHQLRSVSPGEVLVHRIIWTFAVVAILLRWRGDAHWFDEVRARRGGVAKLAAAGVLLAVNWLVYIWAVDHGHVIEAALGYYINPLITVALGVVVLDEHLRRLQVVALGFGGAAVALLTLAFGRVPWIALVLAGTFAAYCFLKKSVSVDAAAALAVETVVLLPVALIAMVGLLATGKAAIGSGSLGRDALLVGLGVVTAVPLLLFGTAASRIPLSLLGLLQYLTPTLQLLCGVLVFHEALPAERVAGFVLVWIALIVLGVDALRSTRRSVLPVPELT